MKSIERTLSQLSLVSTLAAAGAACTPPVNDVIDDTDGAFGGSGGGGEDVGEGVSASSADAGGGADSGDDGEQDDGEADDGADGTGTGEPSGECMEWTRLIGGPADDRGTTIARTPDGSLYVGGRTEGALPGAEHQGESDPFVMRLDDSGEVVWTRQFGTAGVGAVGMLSAASDGTVYAVGAEDIGEDEQVVRPFLRRFNANGTSQWHVVLGDDAPDDASIVATSVAVTEGAAYISGRTNDSFGGLSIVDSTAFIGRYGSDGSLQWVSALESERGSWGEAVAAGPDGEAYLVGFLEVLIEDGPGVSLDAFAARFAPDGSDEWTWRSGYDNVDIFLNAGVGADGTLFVSGELETAQMPPDGAAGSDMIINAIGPDGEDVWGLGWSPSWYLSVPNGSVVGTDEVGNVYLAGKGDGTDDTRLLVLKVGPDGASQWWRAIEYGGDESAGGIVVVAEDDIYLTASTAADVEGQANAGEDDILVMHLCGQG